jgi:hypothetical protein
MCGCHFVRSWFTAPVKTVERSALPRISSPQLMSSSSCSWNTSSLPTQGSLAALCPYKRFPGIDFASIHQQLLDFHLKGCRIQFGRNFKGK